MGMSKKEAIKEGFDWKLYNPYVHKSDLVLFSFIICIVLFSSIFGFFYYTKVCLLINGFLLLVITLVSLIDCLTAERLNDDKTPQQKESKR